MKFIKSLIKKYFESLVYFYRYIGLKIFIILILSVLVAFLDGLGLSMFIPLLSVIGEGVGSPTGKMNFLTRFLYESNFDLTLSNILLIMISFFVMKGIVIYFFEIYKVNVQQNFITKIRYRNLKLLNNLSYKYFVVSDAGRIQNTMTGEVDRVARAFLTYFAAFQAGVMVFVYMVFAFTVDAQFAILVTVGGIITNFLFKKIYTKTKGASRKLTGENNVFQNLVIQNVANYKYLKATGSIEKYSSKLRSSIDKIEKSNKKIGRLGGFLNASREPLVIFVVVCVIYIQTSLMGSPIGPLLISLLFFYRALTFLMQMQNQWNKFLAVSGSMENMTNFTSELKKHQDRKEKGNPSSSIQTLALENAAFKYSSAPIFQNLNFSILKNEIVAFVGESGSGKTTVINVLAGLLPLDKGNFKVNEEISTNINISDYQKRIGYITQDPVIFNDSIYNNITFWQPKTERNIKKFNEAIKKAAIDNFIYDLDNREDSLLGTNGANLSGGQKQRISIARELFKQVEILILDEATSALDSETERSIQKNIDDLKGEYTIIIVAHRISTIKNADRIIILENGNIVESGDFNELILKSEYFKKVVQLQEL